MLRCVEQRNLRAWCESRAARPSCSPPGGTAQVVSRFSSRREAPWHQRHDRRPLRRIEWRGPMGVAQKLNASMDIAAPSGTTVPPAVHSCTSQSNAYGHYSSVSPSFSHLSPLVNTHPEPHWQRPAPDHPGRSRSGRHRISPAVYKLPAGSSHPCWQPPAQPSGFPPEGLGLADSQAMLLNPRSSAVAAGLFFAAWGVVLVGGGPCQRPHIICHGLRQWWQQFCCRFRAHVSYMRMLCLQFVFHTSLFWRRVVPMCSSKH